MTGSMLRIQCVVRLPNAVEGVHKDRRRCKSPWRQRAWPGVRKTCARRAGRRRECRPSIRRAHAPTGTSRPGGRTVQPRASRRARQPPGGRRVRRSLPRFVAVRQASPRRPAAVATCPRRTGWRCGTSAQRPPMCPRRSRFGRRPCVPLLSECSSTAPSAPGSDSRLNGLRVEDARGGIVVDDEDAAGLRPTTAVRRSSVPHRSGMWG